MSEQPTHAMLVRADDGLHLLPACTARKCAERTVTFVTGADVLGIVELYPEPIPGVQFWSAVQLGKAPKTAADASSQWRPISDPPESNKPLLVSIQRAGGSRSVIRAVYAAPRTVQVDEISCGEDFGEYDEENDCYWCPEGWYEWNENEEIHWAVNDDVTDWQPLPTPAATGAQP
ncbi:hypothetical protein [Lysobacter capsici]|uniref:hypothetical protein n=1 Tax=Lysobacter capsici TaxID=435897 RepID=UPI00287BB923|nr:hypothetical protein [Lysobacter capsici]WND79432.1 hypothetical protein RJ610_19325 [Lysobacter capsici]WND84628.1 hypothetical protein RJ609_19340 [Lysobacter capsici]